MADVLAYLPLIRQLMGWAGSISASKQTIIKALSNGHNIGLVVDGIAGMFVKSEQSENILLKFRKGVAKLSLQTGHCVVPCYGFGSSALFESYFDSFGIMQSQTFMHSMVWTSQSAIIRMHNSILFEGCLTLYAMFNSNNFLTLASCNKNRIFSLSKLKKSIKRYALYYLAEEIISKCHSTNHIKIRQK